MEVQSTHTGLSYPPRLHLSGHQTNARPNSASEALREGAIDPGREQGRPGVWARGRWVRWSRSGSRVGLPFYWNLCQEQDYGGRAVRRDRPTDELFHAAGEAGAVLHSLCGAVRKRYERFHCYPPLHGCIHTRAVPKSSQTQHCWPLTYFTKCDKMSLQWLCRNSSQAEEKCDTWMTVWRFQRSVRERRGSVGSENEEWVVLLRANRWFSLLS